MHILLLSITLVLVGSSTLVAQDPGSIPWTQKEAGDLAPVSISVPSKYSSIGLSPTQHRIAIPRGWTASVFFAGFPLDKGRFMSWGPDSVLFIASMNSSRILAMPDRDRDGVADTVIEAARGFSTGHDVRFFRDTMYVAQESGVVKLWRSNTSGYVFDNRITIINKAEQVNQLGGNHRTRTLVIDSVRRKLYLSVGSRGNADRETNRAVVEEYEFDGSGRRVYATGIRNAVGMTLHPRTGKLWANNNGSDNQGNNVPPEWVDIVRDGGFYGYPFAYHFRRWYNFTGDYSDILPITSVDTARLELMAPPGALVDAHCAPMALVFSESNPQPDYQNGAFMAMRGSWNRNPASGAKVVFLRFDSDEDTIANVVVDFCTGFITDTNNVTSRWARPVGLALAADGSVFISLDEGKQCILKITPPATTTVNDSRSESGFTIFPNPIHDSFECLIPGQAASISIYSVRGEVIEQRLNVGGRVVFSTSHLQQGTYSVVVQANGETITKTIAVIR